MHAWSALLVAHRRLTSTLDAELRANADMTLDEYDVLHQLRRAGEPIRMSELAAQVLISRPTTTRVVDRLVGRGWVDRHQDPADRRVVRVGLTGTGRVVLRGAGRLHVDGIARLFEAPLTGAQISAIGDALDAVVAAEGAHRVEPVSGGDRRV